jgi:FkbM family methyltransferase
MKNLIKNLLPSKFVQIWRKNSLIRVSKQKKIFSDGTIYYGVQNEDYEQYILSLLRKISLNYKTFVNLGANTGYYPIRLASQFDTILAVEALSENYSVLTKNIYENNFSNKIICFHLAVGDTFKLVDFYGGSTGGSLVNGWNSQTSFNETVQLIKGDHLVSSFIDDENGALFLIDCEAAEFQVLQGLEKTIASTNSTFLVEIPCREFMPNNAFNPNFLKIFRLMAMHKYTPMLISADGSLTPLSDEMINRFVNENRYEGMMVLYQKTPKLL